MKQKGYKLTLVSILLCLFGACSSSDSEDGSADRTAAHADSIPDLVTQVKNCSRLYTTEYRIRKIVTHDDVVRLKGNVLKQDFDIALPLGERKIAIPMEATLKAYIDFAEFSEKNIEREGERIILLLPDPKVVLTSSKIDRKEVKEYVGLARPRFSDEELTLYEQQGRQAIIDKIASLGIIYVAKENAARVLVPMLVEAGFKEEDIIIAFRKNLDIRELINSNLEKR